MRDKIIISLVIIFTVIVLFVAVWSSNQTKFYYYDGGVFLGSGYVEGTIIKTFKNPYLEELSKYEQVVIKKRNGDIIVVFKDILKEIK